MSSLWIYATRDDADDMPDRLRLPSVSPQAATEGGDCCVFCSYGSLPCPSRQKDTATSPDMQVERLSGGHMARDHIKRIEPQINLLTIYHVSGLQDKPKMLRP